MNQIPPARCGVLYIDDEEKALKYFRMALAPKFSILTASSGEEGLALLRKEPDKIGIVVSDQRMPGMIGAEVLGAVREEFPQVIRILTTAYSDLDSAIQAVNKGHIYQYVVKPWDVTELEMVLHRAADYHQILTERNKLLRLKMTTLQRIICCDRVKWLMLSPGGRQPSGSFDKALGCLLYALRSFPAPSQPETSGFQPDHFDAASLVRSEFHTGSKILEALEKNGEGTPEPAWFEPVSRTGTNGAGLASSLSSFIVSLPAGVTADVSAGDGVHVVISSAPPEWLDSLSTVLFSREPEESSTSLLRTLWRFAESGVPLTIQLNHSSQSPVHIHVGPAVMSADDVIDELQGVFEAWDVASR